MTSPAEVQEARKQMDEWLDNAVREEVLDALVGAWVVQNAMGAARKKLDGKLAEVRELAVQYKNETDQSSWVSERLFEILDGDG